MPTPATLLASALEQLSALQRAGRVAIRSGDLPRGARERLLRNGVLQEVMRGWYVRASPGEQAGDTTAWYAAFWPFVASYLDSRIGTDWCVSADPSLLLHVGDRTVPRQLLVRSPRGNNKPTPLMHGTSVFDVRLELPPPEERAVIDGVRAMTLGASLVHASPGLYHDRVVDVRAALVTIPDASDLLRPLLAGGKSKVAGRLAAALRNVGRERVADEVLAGMRTAGYGVRENDPFEDAATVRWIRATHTWRRSKRRACARTSSRSRASSPRARPHRGVCIAHRPDASLGSRSPLRNLVPRDLLAPPVRDV